MKKIFLTFFCVIVSALLSPVKADVAPLPLPEVPASMTEPQQRADFILAHFWDTLNFAADQRAVNKDFLEHSLADFYSLIPHASKQGINIGWKNLIMRAAASTDALALISDLVEVYLLSDDSPYFNEEAYLSFAENMIQTPTVPKALTLRPKFLIEDINKNAPGSKANDFSFVLPNGKKSSLYSTPVNGKLLLIFFDPECEDCHKLLSKLAAFSSVQEKIDKNELTIMAIYAGEDADAWKKTKDTLPASWIVGFDKGIIDENELYNFPTTPTIYILSPDYKVLEKNASPQLPGIF